MTYYSSTSKKLETPFQFRYEFIPELDEKHTIDLTVYHNSLKSIEEIIRRANHLTNGKGTHVKVEVIANKEGSFITAFAVIYYASQMLVPVSDILPGLGFTGHLLSDAVLLYGGKEIVMDLIGFIKRIKNKKITEDEKIDEDNILIKTDNDEFVVPQQVMDYYQDSIIRKELSNVVTSLEQKEINNISFSRNGEKQQPNVINRDEREYFSRLGDERELVKEKTSKMKKLEVLQPDFRIESDQWRVEDTDTGIDFQATVSDKNYVDKIKAGKVSFKAGTILMVDLKVSTYRYLESGVNRKECEITKVYTDSPINQMEGTEEGQSTLKDII